MRVIIIGCGRVGARVAAELDSRGEHVTVIDSSPRAFSRLPPSFKGETVRGNGTDEDVVRSAGAEQADIVMTLTEGAEATHGFVEPATAEPRRIAPVPGSAADLKVQAAMDAAEDVTAEATVVQPGEGGGGL